MFEIKVFVTEKGYDLNIESICPQCFAELVDGRIFETMREMQDLVHALERGKNTYAITHGTACPRDAKEAIEKIEGLKKYRTTGLQEKVFAWL